MKRTKTIIRIVLILTLMFVIQTRIDQTVGEIEAPVLIQQEVVESIAPVIEVQEPKMVVASSFPDVEMIAEAAPVEVEVLAELPETLDIEVVATDDLSAPEHEEGVRIVKISFSDSEFEASIVMAPTTQELSTAKGFRIYGNWDEAPLNLVVKSSDTEGRVDIHYLDWNARNPNEYQLTNNLGNEAEISVYEAEVQVAQFSLNSPIQDDYIALDLSEPVRMALAQ
ncbi:hypothetical protein HQ585_11350 [candidate division KSB1 bacterium]|nr:hypothetical protein [candidate division KSB1 bacterium]